MSSDLLSSWKNSSENYSSCLLTIFRRKNERRNRGRGDETLERSLMVGKSSEIELRGRLDSNSSRKLTFVLSLSLSVEVFPEE